ncbi:MAG: DNA translocase FtsK [Oscillospiraceae bacterium]|nr:DNA translocase FtsK [Oscillospiraceae bacterium]
MAQKKSTSQASRPKKTSSTRSRSNTTKRAPRKTNTRLVLTLTFFILGVFTLLGYFTSDGLFINLLHSLFTGLFGGGFIALPPVLLFCAGLYAVSSEKPKTLRVVCILLIPIVIGGWFQLFSPNQYDLSFESLGKLYADGAEGIGGGAVSGYIATLFITLFSLIGAFVFEVFFSVACIIGAIGIPADVLGAKLAEKRDELKEQHEVRAEWRRIDAENEALKREMDREDQRRAREELEKKKAAFRSSIDIPMDGEERKEEPEKPKKQVGGPLFNKQSKVKAPDELFKPSEPENEKPEQVHEEIKEEIPEEQVTVAEEPDDEPDVPSFVAPVVTPIAPKPQPKPIAAKPPEPIRPPEPVKAEADEAKSFAALIEENAKREVQEGLQTYKFPPIELLEAPRAGKSDAQSEINATKERLEKVLASFGINSTISNIINGPSVTRYEMELEIGVKLNKLTSLSDDIALALGVGGVRIAAIPNKISTVGIEVPNKNTSTVWLRELIESQEFKNAKSKLTFALGKNIGGEVMLGNINKLPHLLIAGTTGSGKSVSLNSLILSLMYKATPEEVKFIMIDPKMVEFKIYNGIPHLLVPVVTEAKKAAGALQWAVTEMMKRYKLFSEVGARDIAGYNEHLKEAGEKPIPFVVVIIDELADLMLVAAKEVEESICRVAQMGRAAGVHLVIATQSPRADVITGLMKANIPSRISFKVASALESRIILDAGGSADKLMGNGDMLYAPIGTSKPVRIQGAWVSDEERENIVNFVKEGCEASYSEDVIHEIERAAEGKDAQKAQQPAEEKKDYDEMIPQAVEVIFDTQQASVSMLQRRLKLGYARAARLVDQMEEMGIVGPFEGSKPRQILITRQQWQEMQFINGTAPIAPAEQQMSFDDVEADMPIDSDTEEV